MLQLLANSIQKQYLKTFTVPVLSSTTVLTGLPAFEPLTIRLEALDYEEKTITSWTGTVTLNPGRNSIRAVMKPPVEAVSNFPVGAGGVTIPFGKAQFYRYYHDNFNMIWRTQMLIANTNGQGSIWMGVYNENWEPLETIITESKADGWAVFDFTGDETIVYIALAYIRSDGYPPKSSGIQVDLAIKDTYFVNPTAVASVTGSRSEPYNLSDFNNYFGGLPFAAFILGQGTYEPISISGSQWLLGGFDPSDWKKRTPRTSVFTTTQDHTPAIAISGYDTVVLDGLAVRTNVTSGEARAVLYNSTGSLSIKNCEIVGIRTESLTSDITSYALRSDTNSSGSIFIYGSTLSGGEITGAANNSITLVAISIESPIELTVLRSRIDGGTIHAVDATFNDHTLQTSAININVGLDQYTSTIIASSFIWGGVIYSNLISPRTQALTFGDYSNVYITSSILHAGYVNFTGTADMIRMTALGNYSSGGTASLIVAGSILDAGYFETATTIAAAIAYEQQSSISTTIAGSIFITNNNSNTSNAEITPTPVHLLNNDSQPELFDCAFIGPEQRAYVSNSYQPLNAATLIHLNEVISTLFVSYTRPASFAQFLANNWKPAGSLKGLQTTTLPESWGLNSDLLTPYPFLLVDLENKVRPATAYWTIGPYQN
ncbi:MAG TPA: hypothetical protein P5519_02850 [Spirochaetia bacterium]|nr:hypothetical protein [Spirochaetales bacterium]HRS64809.1 hypothetical protein [Spirochaetia bacterium]HRV27675.1 hypothetical protein [Spirochaetia bacterium]